MHRSTRRTVRGTYASVALVAVGLLAAACSSSGNGAASSNTPPAGSTGSTATAPAGSTAAGSTPPAGGVAAAQAKLAPYLKLPTSIGPTTPVGKPIPSGKTIYFVNCNTPGPCTSISDGVSAAAKLLGWTVHTVPTAFSPEAAHSAMAAGVRQNPDAVLSSGFTDQYYGDSLKTFKSHNVPVIEYASGDTAGNGLTYVVDSEGPLINGALMADYDIVATNGKPNVVFFNLPDEKGAVQEFSGYKPEFEKNCPGCKLDEQGVPNTTIGTTLPSTVVGYLRSHSDVNVVDFANDAEAIGVPAAMKQAGLSDKVILTGDASAPVNYGYIANGQEAAGVAIDQFIAGFRMVDAAARAMVGAPLDSLNESPVGTTLPEMIVTKDNIHLLPSQTKYVPMVNDWSSQFKTLWGVS